MEILHCYQLSPQIVRTVLQAEAAFRNYIHRSVHTHTKSTSSPVLSLPNESTVSGTGPAAAQVQAVAPPIATTSTNADKIRESGNYSDIFVCHGKKHITG